MPPRRGHARDPRETTGSSLVPSSSRARWRLSPGTRVCEESGRVCEESGHVSEESGRACTHQHPPRRLPLAGHRHPQPHIIDDGFVRFTWARKRRRESGDPLHPQNAGGGGGEVFWGAPGHSRTLQLDVERLAVVPEGGEGAGVDGTRPRAVCRLHISGGSHQQPGGQRGGGWVGGRGERQVHPPQCPP